MKTKQRAPRQQQAIEKEMKKAHSYFTSMRIYLNSAMKMRKAPIYEPAPLDEDDIEENVAATMQAHQQACNAFESHKEITMLYDQAASESLDYALSCIERLKKLSATDEELAPVWAEFQKHQMMLAH
jgi:mannose-1-phosphate guanylyltransferase